MFFFQYVFCFCAGWFTKLLHTPAYTHSNQMTFFILFFIFYFFLFFFFEADIFDTWDTMIINFLFQEKYLPYSKPGFFSLLFFFQVFGSSPPPIITHTQTTIQRERSVRKKNQLAFFFEKPYI